MGREVEKMTSDGMPSGNRIRQRVQVNKMQCIGSACPRHFSYNFQVFEINVKKVQGFNAKKLLDFNAQDWVAKYHFELLYLVTTLLRYTDCAPRQQAVNPLTAETYSKLNDVVMLLFSTINAF